VGRSAGCVVGETWGNSSRPATAERARQTEPVDELVGEELWFEFLAAVVDQGGVVSAQDGGGDCRVDGRVQPFARDHAGPHAVEQPVRAEQAQPKRCSRGPGKQGQGVGVQEDPVVGQQREPVAGQQQRRGGLASTLATQRQERVAVTDGGAGVQDHPPRSFELHPDELAGDAGGSQAQTEEVRSDERDVSAFGGDMIGDLLIDIDGTNVGAVVDDLDGLAGELDHPVRLIVYGGTGLPVGLGIEPAAQHHILGVTGGSRCGGNGPPRTQVHRDPVEDRGMLGDDQAGGITGRDAHCTRLEGTGTRESSLAGSGGVDLVVGGSEFALGDIEVGMFGGRQFGAVDPGAVGDESQPLAEVDAVGCWVQRAPRGLRPARRACAARTVRRRRDRAGCGRCLP